METFAPTVLIPERRTPYGTIPAEEVTPEGWMWILAFAIRGCPWAVEEASKPGFRERILASLRERRRTELRGAIDHKLDEIEALRKQLRGLGKD